jgi:uncharacterized protein YdeI (YjbR/CyaY-like superfamily)
MSPSEKVTQYIDKHSKWSTPLAKIREVLKTTLLQEEFKWGAPCYTYNEKNIIGLGAFKNHMAIWFHQGVFLKDTDNELVNAQEEKTKALRQWRLEEKDIIEEKILIRYVEEAIENCKAGKELKPSKAKKNIELPTLLKNQLTKNTNLKKAFDALTPGKQREYAEHISSAKRETTQLSRLEKITPLIQAGKGLHDKYKNC